MAGAHGMPVTGHETAPQAPPAPPVSPQPGMACCPVKTPLAPTSRQPLPAALVAAEVQPIAAVVVPKSASGPTPTPTGASPPPLHLLFGCLLV